MYLILVVVMGFRPCIKNKIFSNELFVLKVICTVKKILKERGYKNFENLNEIKQKFDLIIVTPCFRAHNGCKLYLKSFTIF